MWIKIAIYKAVGGFMFPLWKLSSHTACTRTELGIVVNLILLLKQHKIPPTIVQELCTQMPCSCKNFTDFSIKHLIKLSGSALATYFSPGKIQVLTAYQLLLLFFFWLKFLSCFWTASLHCPWWFKLFLPKGKQETPSRFDYLFVVTWKNMLVVNRVLYRNIGAGCLTQHLFSNAWSLSRFIWFWAVAVKIYKLRIFFCDLFSVWTMHWSSLWAERKVCLGHKLTVLFHYWTIVIISLVDSQEWIILIFF